LQELGWEQILNRLQKDDLGEDDDFESTVRDQHSCQKCDLYFLIVIIVYYSLRTKLLIILVFLDPFILLCTKLKT
jgi:hypothetical protein